MPIRAPASRAGEELVAVALQQAHALERNAELVAQHLGERRRVALAVIERAGEDGPGAVWLAADAAHLLVGRRRDLEVQPTSSFLSLAGAHNIRRARRSSNVRGGSASAACSWAAAGEAAVGGRRVPGSSFAPFLPSLVFGRKY